MNLESGHVRLSSSWVSVTYKDTLQGRSLSHGGNCLATQKGLLFKERIYFPQRGNFLPQRGNSFL